MKWMEHFLSGSQLAGKIICPNKKCAAKLGNYDWAGVCCGCKQWVTPVCLCGFFPHPFLSLTSFSRGSASIVPKLMKSYEPFSNLSDRSTNMSSCIFIPDFDVYE
jgi:hypothetical protein